MSSQAYHYTTHYSSSSSYEQYYSQPTSTTTSTSTSSSTSKSHAHSHHHHHSSSSSSSSAAAIENWTSYNNSSSWKSPTTIDDNDLKFDGKPLNLLHEENQNRLWGGGESKRRGRSRVKK